MAQSYAEFMPRIMEYAVDSAAEAATRTGFNLPPLTEELFVDQLYVTSPNQVFEDSLYHRLLSSPHLTCIAAYRGSGKTSALRHAVSRLLREHPTKVAPVIVDVKQLYDNGVFSPLNDKPTDEVLGRAYHIFKTEIRKVVQQRLLPGSANTLKLLAWALAGLPDDTDRFSDLLVSSLLDLSDRAITGARALNKNRRERITAIAHFLEDERRFREFHQEALTHITTAHVVRAGMAIRGWRRVALIFDNIDRIPMPYQVKFMEAVNDTHNALGGACGTVVAIRRETLRSSVPRPNENGDPIDIIAPNDAEYPFILFPDTKADHVKQILQRRHEYSIQFYQNNYPAPSGELEQIIALHASLVDEFVRDSIHALANGSIRALAKIYTGFFRYVQRADAAGITRGQDLRTDEGHLQTLFFLFLRENAKEYGLIYYEIVRRDVDRFLAVDVPELASAHHLILTALLNLTSELRETAGGEHDATFQQLADRVMSLGFSLDTVRNAIAEMYAPTGESPRTIEFVDHEPSIEMLPANSPCRLRLTPLGHVLVTSLLHKVGYVWGQAYDSYVRAKGRRERPRSYYDLDASERVRIFFYYLRELALSHLKLLALVRSRLEGKHDALWLRVYRTRFGVNGQFQVQRLCASAAAFYAPGFTRAQGNPFLALRHNYNGLVADIGQGIPYDDLDLRVLPSRFEDYYRPRLASLNSEESGGEHRG